MSLIKWGIYTVLLALTPVLMRLLIVMLATPNSNAQWLKEGDIISFGLILAITNISALEHDTASEPDWKTKHIGLSLLLIAAFATLFAVTCFEEIAPNSFAQPRLLWAAITLSVACVLYSYAVWSRLLASRSTDRSE